MKTIKHKTFKIDINRAVCDFGVRDSPVWEEVEVVVNGNSVEELLFFLIEEVEIEIESPVNLSFDELYDLYKSDIQDWAETKADDYCSKWELL